jgi:hypothetical protein
MKANRPDYSWPHRNPKRKRGRVKELASLTHRFAIAQSAPRFPEVVNNSE